MTYYYLSTIASARLLGNSFQEKSTPTSSESASMLEHTHSSILSYLAVSLSWIENEPDFPYILSSRIAGL